MKSFEAYKQQQQIDELFARASRLSADAEMLSDWAKYLCVRVSGYIEESVRILLREFVREKAEPRVVNYTESRLVQFQNPKIGKIAELVGCFSQEWQDKLESITTDEMKGAINSIVANRHQIAHGRNVNITIGRMKEYFIYIVKYIEALEDIIQE